MKQYKVIVPPDVPDVVEISGKPHTITDTSFTQSESHNAQMIVYCTVSPVSYETCEVCDLFPVVADNRCTCHQEAPENFNPIENSLSAIRREYYRHCRIEEKMLDEAIGDDTRATFDMAKYEKACELTDKSTDLKKWLMRNGGFEPVSAIVDDMLRQQFPDDVIEPDEEYYAWCNYCSDTLDYCTCNK